MSAPDPKLTCADVPIAEPNTAVFWPRSWIVSESSVPVIVVPVTPASLKVMLSLPAPRLMKPAPKPPVKVAASPTEEKTSVCVLVASAAPQMVALET